MGTASARALWPTAQTAPRIPAPCTAEQTSAGGQTPRRIPGRLRGQPVPGGSRPPTPRVRAVLGDGLPQRTVSKGERRTWTGDSPGRMGIEVDVPVTGQGGSTCPWPEGWAGRAAFMVALPRAVTQLWSREQPDRSHLGTLDEVLGQNSSENKTKQNSNNKGSLSRCHSPERPKEMDSPTSGDVLAGTPGQKILR